MHGAPRRRRQPGQVHGDGVMFQRDLVNNSELVRRRVVVSLGKVVGEPNRGGRRRRLLHI